QETLGLRGTEVLHQDADHAYAEAVHQYGDRHGRGHHDQSHPQREADQADHDDAQRQQREQVAQPAAGFDHLQFVGTQVEHVALQEHADAEDADHRDPDPGGHQLQE